MPFYMSKSEEMKSADLEEDFDPTDPTNGFAVFVVPKEYIHWGGFVVSFLLVAIASLFLKFDTAATGELTPTGYIDMVMLFASLIMCARCLYLYVATWFSYQEEDEDDDSPTGGCTSKSDLNLRMPAHV